jgi:hypothetical protein
MVSRDQPYCSGRRLQTLEWYIVGVWEGGRVGCKRARLDGLGRVLDGQVLTGLFRLRKEEIMDATSTAVATSSLFGAQTARDVLPKIRPSSGSP